MKTLHRIGLIAVPLTFVFAGAGMLWLLKVKNAEGAFFDRILNNEFDWLGAHVLLLISAILILPAAFSIRYSIHNRNPGILANVAVIVIAPSAILLAGQYAIDFVMPLIAKVGNEAIEVHGLLFSTPLINTLFYELPNLVFLGLLILTIALVWSGTLSRLSATLLMINWLAVLFGNLVDSVFQRVSLTLLALSYVPFVISEWSNTIEPNDP